MTTASNPNSTQRQQSSDWMASPPCCGLSDRSRSSQLTPGDSWSCDTNTSPFAVASSPPGRLRCQTVRNKRWLPPTVCLQHVRLSKHQLPEASPRLWLMRWSWADLLTLPGWPGPTGSTHTTRPPVNDSASVFLFWLLTSVIPACRWQHALIRAIFRTGSLVHCVIWRLTLAEQGERSNNKERGAGGVVQHWFDPIVGAEPQICWNGISHLLMPAVQSVDKLLVYWARGERAWEAADGWEKKNISWENIISVFQVPQYLDFNWNYP